MAEKNPKDNVPPASESAEQGKKEHPKAVAAATIQKEVHEDELVEAISEANEAFAHIGGDNAAFVKQALLPALKKAGIKLVK